MELPHILLNHVSADGRDRGEVKIELDELDRRNTWLKHVVLLPWTTPQRLIGFVHPAAEVGSEPFTLHTAYTFVGGLQVQQMPNGKVGVVPTPRLTLPYELVTPVDIRIYHCLSAIWVKEQAQDFQDFIAALMRQQFFPPVVEVAKPQDMPPAIKL